MRPSLAIRFTIVIALLIILVLIGWNFVTQSKRKLRVPSKSEEIASERVEKSEKIEYFEVEGAKGNFKVEADQHYMGDDNKYHLEGNVKIVFFKKREGQDVYIYAQQVIYDEDWNHFFIFWHF